MDEYSLEGNNEEDIPYIQMELDIRDVYQVYQSLSFHLDRWPGNESDPYEQERIKQMRDFFYRMVLEFKFSVDSSEERE